MANDNVFKVISALVDKVKTNTSLWNPDSSERAKSTYKGFREIRKNNIDKEWQEESFPALVFNGEDSDLVSVNCGGVVVDGHIISCVVYDIGIDGIKSTDDTKENACSLYLDTVNFLNEKTLDSIAHITTFLGSRKVSGSIGVLYVR